MTVSEVMGNLASVVPEMVSPTPSTQPILAVGMVSSATERIRHSLVTSGRASASGRIEISSSPVMVQLYVPVRMSLAAAARQE